MTIARREIVKDGEATYHCTSRCVRRAFLCGYDTVTKRSFNHRKKWVQDRLKFLVNVFCLDVLAYALMDNHLHVLIRTRPELAAGLDDEEVARRWLTLYPSADSKQINSSEPSPMAIEALARNRERIALLRRRLGSISWFMKSISEFIARRANREDDCTGRFWEGRFKCQRICDVGALLTCSLYIDLNPIRAKISNTPEESEFTSAYDRIKSIRDAKRGAAEPALWISPIQGTKDRRGYLPITLPEYLSLLDAVGRQIRANKRGSIPGNLAPILTRLGIRSENFIETTLTFGSLFSSFAGCRQSLEHAAHSVKRAWVKGFGTAERAFV